MHIFISVPIVSLIGLYRGRERGHNNKNRLLMLRIVIGGYFHSAFRWVLHMRNRHGNYQVIYL